LNSFLRQPLGRLFSRGDLDALLLVELRFTGLVCSFFSRPATRFSNEFILAFSCAIESSLLPFRLVAPMTRKVMTKRTIMVIIDFDTFIVLILSHLQNRRLKCISHDS